MKKFIQVLTTVKNEEDAVEIANKLLENRLGSCVQIIGPVRSTYWWMGKIETEEEWMCVVKSEKNYFKEIEDEIKKIHPYEVPEIVAIPIVLGSRNYFEWLNDELKK